MAGLLSMLMAGNPLAARAVCLLQGGQPVFHPGTRVCSCK